MACLCRLLFDHTTLQQTNISFIKCLDMFDRQVAVKNLEWLKCDRDTCTKCQSWRLSMNEVSSNLDLNVAVIPKLHQTWRLINSLIQIYANGNSCPNIS